MENSTISNNQGAGIRNFTGAVIIQNSTITKNSNSNAGQFVAGGIESTSGSVHIQNSILADNTGYGKSPQDCVGNIISDGQNIIGVINGCGMTPQLSDQVGVNPTNLGSYFQMVILHYFHTVLLLMQVIQSPVWLPINGELFVHKAIHAILARMNTPFQEMLPLS